MLKAWLDEHRDDDPRPQLPEEIVREIQAWPNAEFVLLEMARNGYLTAERAVTAADEATREPLWFRVAMALVDTLFGRRPRVPPDF